MKHITVITGLCIACLLAGILVAGCTSQDTGNAPVQTPVPQITGQPVVPATPEVTSAPEGTSQDAPDAGLISDAAGDQAGSDQSSVTMAADIPAAPSSGTAEQNVTSESADLGDILP
jgi:hypothetical protein